jgi:hypothetical protein
MHFQRGYTIERFSYKKRREATNDKSSVTRFTTQRQTQSTSFAWKEIIAMTRPASDLDAFSHYPADGSVTALAVQPTVLTNENNTHISD